MPYAAVVGKRGGHAELQRRQGAAGGSSRRLLPEALAEVDVALEELAVTGQELREQTAELAVAREALEAERERYQELFQPAPVAYLVTDPLGGIREANRAAAELLQVRPGHLPGKPRPTTTRPSRRSAQPRSAATTWRSGRPT
jgi:PAS domain-containing protein